MAETENNKEIKKSISRSQQGGAASDLKRASITPQTLEEKGSQKETPTEHSLSFEEGVQRAVEEVSSWPDWKVRNMRSIFSSQRGWKVDGKK